MKIVGYLRDSKTEQMSVAFDIQKRFSTLLMQDVDATRFIAEFAKILNAPIILLSPWQQVIAHSNYFMAIKIGGVFHRTIIKRPLSTIGTRKENLSFTG